MHWLYPPPLLDWLLGFRGQLRKFGPPIAQELDQLCVAATPGCDKRAMDRLRSIVNQRSPRERGQRAAGFVHQKISCGKVPIVTIAANDADVELALRNTGQTKSKRANSGHRNDAGIVVGQLLQKALWPDGPGPGKADCLAGEDRKSVV